MARLKYSPVSIGMRVRVTVPKIQMQFLDVMDAQSVGNAVREALRSAGRPAVTALKSLLRSDLIKSDQSTGASERAVAMKYGRSRSNARRFFLLVGMDKRVSEIHTSRVPEGYTTKLKLGRKQRGRGMFGLRSSTNKKGVSRSKQVFSRYRNDYRITKLAGRPFKRRPSKYFHLIDRGFNHRNAGRVAGYDFIAKLQASLGHSIQDTFVERLSELVIPTIKREIARNFKSVFK